MNLKNLADSIHSQFSKYSNVDTTQVGWLTWNANQQKTPFTEGITIIKSKSSFPHQFKAYIVCVKESNQDEDSEVTDLEDTCDDDIPMTPMLKPFPESHVHTSIPDSDDSDDDSIILSSQKELSAKKKTIRPNPGTPSDSCVEGLFWNSSSQSPSMRLHLDDTVQHKSTSSEINVYEALTQPNDPKMQADYTTEKENSIKSKEIQLDDIYNLETQKTNFNDILDQETEYWPPEKKHIIDEDDEDELTQIIEPENEKHETEDISKKTFVNAIKSTHKMIDNEMTQSFPRSIFDQETEFCPPESNVNECNQLIKMPPPQIPKSLRNLNLKKLVNYNEEKEKDHAYQLKAQTKCVNSLENDDLMTDSQVCDFGYTEELEPNSPDSMSLLVDCENIISNIPDKQPEAPAIEQDPYDLDTQMIIPIIETVSSRTSDKDACEDDDQLTQVEVPENILQNKLFDRIEESVEDKNIEVMRNEPLVSMINTADVTNLKQCLFPEDSNRNASSEDPASKKNYGVLPNIQDQATQSAADIICDSQDDIFEECTQENTPSVASSSADGKMTVKSEDIIRQLDISMSHSMKSPAVPLGTKCKRLLSADFKEEFSLRDDILNHITTHETGPMLKRKVLGISNDNFAFSTPATKKKKTRNILADTSFESFIKINHLDSSLSTPKNISFENQNYYNDTREIEKDLLSQTLVEPAGISPLVKSKFPVSSKDNSNKKDPIMDDEKEFNYYGCTQEIENDLLTQASPIKVNSVPCQIVQKCFKNTTKVSTQKKPQVLAKESNYYLCTQEIENDLLSQVGNQKSSTAPGTPDPGPEECSNSLLGDLPSKNCSQNSEFSEYLEESRTPLKKSIKHTFSESDLDSPQIKNFALRTKSHGDQCSNSDLDDDSKNDNEDSESPIVFRKNVPKKRKKAQPVVKEKKIRTSSRVKQGVKRYISEYDEPTVIPDAQIPKVVLEKIVLIEKKNNDSIIDTIPPAESSTSKILRVSSRRRSVYHSANESEISNPSNPSKKSGDVVEKCAVASKPIKSGRNCVATVEEIPESKDKSRGKKKSASEAKIHLNSKTVQEPVVQKNGKTSLTKEKKQQKTTAKEAISNESLVLKVDKNKQTSKDSQLDSKPKSSKIIKKVMHTQVQDVPVVNIVKSLGGSIVEKGGDVLVMGGSRRTMKLMMALTLGVPVVSLTWLSDSKKNKRFMDPWDYILKDNVLETRFGFDMRESLRTVQPHLQGWVVYLTPHIQPSPNEMEELITASGGRAVVVKGLVGRRSGSTGVKGLRGTFSLTCPEDRALWSILPRPLIKTEAVMLGAISHHVQLEGYKIIETEDVKKK